jgi:hypothetical protein
LLLQGMVYRLQKGETEYRDVSRAREAEAQLAAEWLDDFAALLATLPTPELSPAGAIQDRAVTANELMEEVTDYVMRPEDEAGAMADEVAEYATEWAATVAQLRDECNAIQADADAHGLDLDAIENPAGDGSVADLIREAAPLLQHPTVRLIVAEAEKQAAHLADAEPEAQEHGEGAQAPAPEAEPVAEAQEDGEGAQAPAPEAGPVAEAQDPEAGPVAEAQEDGEGAQAPRAEPVAEAQPAAPKGRGARRGKGRK